MRWFDYDSRNNTFMDLPLYASLSDPTTFSFYQQPVADTQNAFVGDVLVYFRERGSRIRPYLSQGGGLVHISSRLNCHSPKFHL